MDSGFWMLEPGSIGTMSYIIGLDKKISQEKREAIINQNTNAQINKLISDLCLNPMGASDPRKIYQKARDESNDSIDLQLQGKDLKTINLQVNQKDSYDEILKIESNPKFENWLDPHMIEEFKNAYEKSIEK